MPLVLPDNRVVPVPALLKRFALIYLPIVMVLSIVLLSSVRLDEQMRVEKIEGRETSRIEIAKGLVTQDLSAVETDLRLIANLPLLRWYQDSGNPAQREELAKFFLILARETRRYDQVRYLNASGQEVICINYNDGKPVSVPREQLQNKAGRYYFDDTLKLKQGEIFVSPFDLNVEHGSLEIPHKPTIRFGTPVFDSAGNKKGIILLNYFGNELLQHFREVMRGGDPRNGMLLNRDGYWLSGAQREDEWGFMLGKNERNFGHDFAEAWRAISATEQGSLRTDQGLFVYTTVYPLLRGQHSSTGSALANMPSLQELAAHEYQWKIVSLVPHAVLSGTAFYNQTSGRILLIFAYLLLALATWIIAFVTLSRKQARAELAKNKARYDELVRHIPVGVYTFRFHGDGSMSFEYVSPVFCQILGLDADAVLRDANIAFTAVHPDDLDSLIRSNQEAAVSLKPFRWEGRFIVRGETRWMHIASDSTPRSGEGSLWNGVVNDITERKKLESELERQAYIDVLTGLPNRRLLMDRLHQALAVSARSEQYGAVMFLDMDHFKTLNDTKGHDAGDMLLIEVAKRLQGCVRDVDTVARLGGDEFVVVLEALSSADVEAAIAAELVAKKIRTALNLPYQLQEYEYRTTASIGVSMFYGNQQSVDELLKCADKAMYQAKTAGRNTVRS